MKKTIVATVIGLVFIGTVNARPPKRKIHRKPVSNITWTWQDCWVKKKTWKNI